MNFAIIFNKDTAFLLFRAQKTALALLNANGAEFKPCFPLWLFLDGNFFDEKEIKISSIKIEKPEIKGENLIFPVTQKIQGKEISSFIKAGCRFRNGKTAGDENQLESLDTNDFPIQPRVFRLARVADFGKNAFAAESSKWIRLS